MSSIPGTHGGRGSRAAGGWRAEGVCGAGDLTAYLFAFDARYADYGIPLFIAGGIADGFDHFRCDRPLTLGINLAYLAKVLKCAR